MRIRRIFNANGKPYEPSEKAIPMKCTSAGHLSLKDATRLESVIANNLVIGISKFYKIWLEDDIIMNVSCYDPKRPPKIEYIYDTTDDESAEVVPVLHFDDIASKIHLLEVFEVENDKYGLNFTVIDDNIAIPIARGFCSCSKNYWLYPFGIRIKKDELKKDDVIGDYARLYIPELSHQHINPAVNIHICDETKFGDNTKEDIGLRIATARVNAGMTQEELGDKIGVSAQFIDKVERGKRVPVSSTLGKLCKAINTPPGFILCNDLGCAADPLNELFQLLCYRSMEEKMIALDVVKAIFKYDGFKIRREK